MAEAQLDAVERRTVLEDPLDVPSRRPAAVVADAVEAHRVPDRRVGRVDGQHHLAVEIVRAAHVAREDAEAEHLAAAGAAPAEERRGQLDLARVRAVEDVAGVALGRQDVGQRGRVPERVDVVADGRAHAEAVGEVAPPVPELATQAELRRGVGVGLHVLTAGHGPLPALHERAHALEQAAVEPLDPAVEPRLAARVDELGVLVAAVGRRAERRERLVDAGLPPPQPDGIDVGVAHHVDDHGRAPFSP